MKQAIICLAVIIGIVLLCFCVLFFGFYFELNHTLQSYKEYNEDDFIVLGAYSVLEEEHEYLGKKPGNPSTNIWELEGLPQKDFLYVTGGLYGDIENVVMFNTSVEPLFTYNISKIAVQTRNGQEITVVDNPDSIEQLVSLRKSETYSVVEHLTSYSHEIRFYFDLPCGLVCDVPIDVISTNLVKMYGQDLQGEYWNDPWQEYTITGALAQAITQGMW